jgi:hypothetical protein
MAKKKIGIYGTLESTANHKVEDLYIIVDQHSIHFAVKHIESNKYIAFESFVNGTDLNGFAQLLAYLQNNSKLMHAVYHHVYFVMNNARVLISKVQNIKDDTIYQNELNLVFGIQADQELLVSTLQNNQVLISSIPDVYQTLLTRAFPTGRWMHYANVIVKDAIGDGVYLYFFESYYIVMIMHHQTVQFLKYFEEAEDAQNVYNILNTCKHIQFDPNASSLFLKGYHAENHQWAVELGNYFNKAIIEQAPEEYGDHFATYFIF